MESCGIGKVIAWKKRMFRAKENSVLVEFPKWGDEGVTMEKKQVTCPNGSTPLAVWVHQVVNAGGYTCSFICDPCYRELYGGAALPSAESAGSGIFGYYVYAQKGEVALDPLRFFR